MSSILVPYENSNLEIDSCYNITIPKGTDAERTHASFSLKEGALRYNTTSNTLEYYNSSSWVAPAVNLTGLSDVGTATATCGNLLIGGGASFTSQAISGDITLAANGSTEVQTSVICSQTCATIDSNNDYLLVVDATDNTYKKVLACDFSVCCAATAGSSGGGTSDSADCLTTARNFSITGDITAAAVSFDGQADVTLNASIGAGCVTMGSDTTGDYVATVTAGTGLTSTGASSGESIAHSLSVDAAQSGVTSVGELTGLVVNGVTDVCGAMVVARLASNPGTTDGTIFYNTNTCKFQGLADGTWVDLH